MELSGKIAVVTGGASGLGRETCSQLVDRGMKVAIFDMNEEGAQQAVAELGEENATYALVDVTSEESVIAGLAHVKETFGVLHLCVNCAGIAPAQKVLDHENKANNLSTFITVININLIGSFNVARLAAELMAENEQLNDTGERGVIVNTASVAAFEGQLGQTAYSASKGGIVALSLPMARELAPVGIRVNAIAPGIMETPMLLGMPDKLQEGLVDNIQFPKRMGYPSEYAALAIHIAENSYINGEVIRMDGAIRMQPR